MIRKNKASSVVSPSWRARRITSGKRQTTGPSSRVSEANREIANSEISPLTAFGRNDVGGASRGFTILEVLLAMTLFTVVMASSYGIFSMGLQIWRRTQGAITVERDLSLAFERMGESFRSSLKSSAGDFAAKGKETSVTLPSVMSIPGKEDKLHYHYSLKTFKWDIRKRILCMSEEPVDEKITRLKSTCRELVSDVHKLKFRYWIQRGVAENYGWYDRFDPSDGLPQAIRVSVELNPQFKGEKSRTKREHERTFLIPVGGASAGLSETFGVVK